MKTTKEHQVLLRDYDHSVRASGITVSVKYEIGADVYGECVFNGQRWSVIRSRFCADGWYLLETGE